MDYKKARKHYFFLLKTLGILGFFSLAACATASQRPSSPEAASASSETAARIYQSLDREKSLLGFLSCEVIDDFNSGQLRNRRGAMWEGSATGAGTVGLVADKMDARSEERGYSLKAVFQIPAHEYAVVESKLPDLDASRAEHLILKTKLRLESGTVSNGRVLLRLADRSGIQAVYDISGKLKPNGEGETWGEIAVPAAVFKELDLNRLGSLSFEIRSGRNPWKGIFWIDEIAFYAPLNLGFESQKDNLAGFPASVVYPERISELSEKAGSDPSGEVFLKEVARDTWRYFLNARDRRTHLVVDHIRAGRAPLAANYTSITNIAMDFLATVAAYDLGFVTRDEAVEKIQGTFTTLKELRRWKGFFYNFYNTTNLSVARNFISTVDSGWLAISLVVLRQAFPEELSGQASRWLDETDFLEFLDFENNQLAIGFDLDKGERTPYHYGMLASEARATSFYAIGKGDVPREHWWFIFRTPPSSWRWQNQVPQGGYTMHEGIEIFQGYYRKGAATFVPSWGGGLFEFLMPTLVMRERELAPQGLGLNNRIATELQRDYALKEKGYEAWGISPAVTVSGQSWRYQEFGIKELAVKGYPDNKIVTPHVSFLALDSLPEAAIKNIKTLFEFGIYGEYGFYDSLDLGTRQLNPHYLALDQGMTLVAICNYLKKGSIQKRFHADPVGKNAESLLQKESFFNQ